VYKIKNRERLLSIQPWPFQGGLTAKLEPRGGSDAKIDKPSHNVRKSKFLLVSKGWRLPQNTRGETLTDSGVYQHMDIPKVVLH
jgi:hypothetical protein